MLEDHRFTFLGMSFIKTESMLSEILEMLTEDVKRPGLLIDIVEVVT